MEHSIYQIILQNLHKNLNFCDSDSVAITLSSAAAATCTVQYYSSTVMVITAGTRNMVGIITAESQVLTITNTPQELHCYYSAIDSNGRY